MEIEITEQQQKDYLEEPDKCPVCHTGNITACSDSSDWSDMDAWRTVICLDCKHQWIECFKLWTITNLEDVQGNP